MKKSICGMSIEQMSIYMKDNHEHKKGKKELKIELSNFKFRERKQIVMMADENLKFSSPLCNKLLRNGD